MRDDLQFRIAPKRVALWLGGVALLLVLLNMASAWLWTDDGLDVVSYDYVNMFDLDEEESFGTWFAVLTLLLAAGLSLLVARASRRDGDGLRGWWLVLGLGFVYLSIDEVAGIHEFLNTYGGDLLGLTERWTTYALIGVGVLAIAYLPFLRALWRGGRRKTLGLLILSGLVYVGGAVGVEKVSPDDPEAFSTLAYNLGWISLEEGMEMAGIVLVIYALLDCLRGASAGELTVAVEAPRADGSAASS